jgi:acetyl-CoA C-acetyltransferase
MSGFRKKVFAAAGATSLFYGPGRKEFDPSKPMPTYETYLKATSKGTLDQVPHPEFDEGVIGSFMSAKFLNQANIPGLLPFMIPSLEGKPCIGVEGACGTGGRAIGVGIRSLLAEFADTFFVAGFEVQNCVKSVYGADILAGAAYYNGQRKSGHAFFFPGIFAERAGAYYKLFGEEKTRQAMAKWYENAILNARKQANAQEFHNETKDLLSLGMTPPNPSQFLPYLNLVDCSKVTDGAASIVLATEEGLKKLGLSKANAIEIIAIGEAEGDITKPAEDPTVLTQVRIAVKKALAQANIKPEDIGMLEVHDCFSITGLLMLEAAGFASHGKAADLVLEGLPIPVNQTGGLIGFGHPTGASGVRMLVDLQRNLAKSSKSPYGMMISMGGDDKTVSAVIVRI